MRNHVETELPGAQALFLRSGPAINLVQASGEIFQTSQITRFKAVFAAIPGALISRSICPSKASYAPFLSSELD